MEKRVSRIAETHMVQVNHVKTNQDTLEVCLGPISKFAALLLTVTKLVNGPGAMENG